MGFKDVGVPFPVAENLNERDRSLGAVSYMEVVSTSLEACLNQLVLRATLACAAYSVAPRSTNPAYS